MKRISFGLFVLVALFIFSGFTSDRKINNDLSTSLNCRTLDSRSGWVDAIMFAAWDAQMSIESPQAPRTENVEPIVEWSPFGGYSIVGYNTTVCYG